VSHDSHGSADDEKFAGNVLHDARDVSSSEKHLAEGSQFGKEGGTEEARLTLHEEQLDVSKREVRAGELDIHKRVQEEYVQQSIPVTHEEITVEHRPYTGPDSDRVPEKDEIARVLLYREEVVTTKRVVPSEEVVVTKTGVTDHQTVGATLRSEHVETTQVDSSQKKASNGGKAAAARG
jgi:uncharacterized protein (TIGR02271 family)